MVRCSLQFSLSCWRFAELLESVNLCLLSNWGNSQPLFFKIFVSIPIFLLSLKYYHDVNVGPFDIVPQIPETLIIIIIFSVCG